MKLYKIFKMECLQGHYSWGNAAYLIVVLKPCHMQLYNMEKV